MPELTTKEVAETLDLPLGTLKRWVKEIPIRVETDSAGHYRYDERAVEVLKQIKTWRLDEGRGMQTIRRRIDPSPEQAQAQPDLAPNPVQSGTDPSPIEGIDTKILVAEVAAEVVAVIRGENSLAESYAKAAHRIGELEERVRTLEAERERLGGELTEAKEKILLLEAPKERSGFLSRLLGAIRS